MTVHADDIDCWWTIKASALATLDALCCVPCCCFCGGCCGRFDAFAMRLDGDDKTKQGFERFTATCTVQTYAGVIVPCTACLCCWACCGTATPCAKGLVSCVIGVEKDGKVHPTTTAEPVPVVAVRAQ